MSKSGKWMVVMVAIVVQIVLGIVYGFSSIQIPASVCFIIWCACTMMICRFVEAPDMI